MINGNLALKPVNNITINDIYTNIDYIKETLTKFLILEKDFNKYIEIITSDYFKLNKWNYKNNNMLDKLGIEFLGKNDAIIHFDIFDAIKNNIFIFEFKIAILYKFFDMKGKKVTKMFDFLSRKNLTDFYEIFNNEINNNNITLFENYDNLRLKLKELKFPHRKEYKQVFLLRILSLFINNENNSKSNIWNVNTTLSQTNISPTSSSYKINFKRIISDKFKELAKDFITFRHSNVDLTTIQLNLRSVTYFLNYYTEKYNVEHFNDFNRKEFELYMIYAKNNKSEDFLRKNLISIRQFFNYLELADRKECPKKHINNIISNEDLPKSKWNSRQIDKHIPDNVIEKLQDNIKFLDNKDFIVIVATLLATGWRSSDVFNMRYDTALINNNDDYYLETDINKTKIKNHRVPVKKEIYDILLKHKEYIISISNEYNNPKKFLFININNKRSIGFPYKARTVATALNKLAIEKNILDEHNKPYKFNLHSFRHSKAIELINSGMNLVHVQKWLAHLSPYMTLHYAKILDTTMKKSWEETTKKGIFQMDDLGNMNRIDMTELDENIIEWEWIKHNLDAVRMPLGFCMKSDKLECPTQLNPCLTCQSLCTTPDFIPEYENEINKVNEMIEIGKKQGRLIWVEKNQTLKDRLENVLNVLKTGNIKHDAGKTGREITKRNEK